MISDCWNRDKNKKNQHTGANSHPMLSSALTKVWKGLVSRHLRLPRFGDTESSVITMRHSRMTVFLQSKVLEAIVFRKWVKTCQSLGV